MIYPVKVLDGSGNLKKQWTREEALLHFEGDVYKVSKDEMIKFWGRASKELEVKPVKQWTYGRKNKPKAVKFTITCLECGTVKQTASNVAKYCSRICQCRASSRRSRHLYKKGGARDGKHRAVQKVRLLQTADTV